MNPTTPYLTNQSWIPRRIPATHVNKGAVTSMVVASKSGNILFLDRKIFFKPQLSVRSIRLKKETDRNLGYFARRMNGFIKWWIEIARSIRKTSFWMLKTKERDWKRVKLSNGTENSLNLRFPPTLWTHFCFNGKMLELFSLIRLRCKMAICSSSRRLFHSFQSHSRLKRVYKRRF